MSPHSMLVFVHLFAAFLLIGGATSMRVGLVLMRSASQGSEALGAYRAYTLAPMLIGPSLVLTVLTGIILAWHIGYTWRALWVSASVALSIAIVIWREVVVGPPAKFLHAASLQAAADPAAHGGALIALARQRRLHLGHLGIELANVAILALMVFKPMSL
jgi:uncharacterized membrane protein